MSFTVNTTENAHQTSVEVKLLGKLLWIPQTIVISLMMIFMKNFISISPDGFFKVINTIAISAILFFITLYLVFFLKNCIVCKTFQVKSISSMIVFMAVSIALFTYNYNLVLCAIVYFLTTLFTFIFIGMTHQMNEQKKLKDDFI